MNFIMRVFIILFISVAVVQQMMHSKVLIEENLFNVLFCTVLVHL